MPGISEPTHDLAAIEAERDRIRTTHLKPPGERSASTARGLHHTALISSDVERTVRFYQDVLGFPLTELIENRDYPGSSHFFFDIGNGNLLAFFDFPGLDVGPYAEVLGGLHHMAISVEPSALGGAAWPARPTQACVRGAQRGLDLLPGPRWCPDRADRGPARRDVRLAGALSVPVVVRPVAEPDRERWAELYRGYAAFYEVPPPDLDHLWRRITELGELECFVADLDGDVVGHGTCARVRAAARGRLGRVPRRPVRGPGRRGSGAGDALLSHLRLLARERGWGVVTWITGADNRVARRLYDRVSEAQPWVTYDMAPGSGDDEQELSLKIDQLKTSSSRVTSARAHSVVNQESRWTGSSPSLGWPSAACGWSCWLSWRCSSASDTQVSSPAPPRRRRWS